MLLCLTTSISHHYTRTTFFPGMLDVFLKTEEGRKAVGGSTVIGRVGRPEDIGASCIYLSSRAGSYVNGAVLPVDGGGLVGRYANM